MTRSAEAPVRRRVYGPAAGLALALAAGLHAVAWGRVLWPEWSAGCAIGLVQSRIGLWMSLHAVGRETAPFLAWGLVGHVGRLGLVLLALAAALYAGRLAAAPLVGTVMTVFFVMMVAECVELIRAASPGNVSKG